MEINENRPDNFHPIYEVAACYLEAKGDLLLLQRSSTQSYSGFWGLPAGKLELNETPLQAAIRELFEETAISLDANLLLSLGCLYIRRDIDYIYHLFGVRLLDRPLVHLSPEHQAYQWVSLDQVERLPLMPGGLYSINAFKQAMPIRDKLTTWT